MKKNIFSSLLAVLILFWAVGMTSYSQEKTEKSQAKTEKMEKKVKVDIKKTNVGKVSVVSKDKMIHKHYKKLGKVDKDKMKEKHKTEPIKNGKSK
jgi:hypothetical protein